MKREFKLPVAGPALSLSRKELRAPGLPITFCLAALWILVVCLLPEGPDLVAMILALCEVLGALSSRSGCSASLTWLFLFLVHKVILGYCPVSWGLRISALNVVFPALSAPGEQVLHPVFVLLLRIKDFNFNLPRVEEKIRHASQILWL